MELGFWSGRYPEADLRLSQSWVNVMNLLPRGDIDAEDTPVTPRVTVVAVSASEPGGQ
ncbi:MAG: hypothetical protein IPL28_24830 [Chloroflexi bacterium]|nr:hypothetical protein [Chloroflexota bacterium]